MTYDRDQEGTIAATTAASRYLERKLQKRIKRNKPMTPNEKEMATCIYLLLAVIAILCVLFHLAMTGAIKPFA